jgi:hypothetical protein
MEGVPAACVALRDRPLAVYSAGRRQKSEVVGQRGARPRRELLQRVCRACATEPVTGCSSETHGSVSSSARRVSAPGLGADAVIDPVGRAVEHFADRLPGPFPACTDGAQAPRPERRRTPQPARPFVASDAKPTIRKRALVSRDLSHSGAAPSTGSAEDAVRLQRPKPTSIASSQARHRADPGRPPGTSAYRTPSERLGDGNPRNDPRRRKSRQTSRSGGTPPRPDAARVFERRAIGERCRAARRALVRFDTLRSADGSRRGRRRGADRWMGAGF